MTTNKFIVCAPPYMNGSAGVVVLHELCDALIKLGYETYLLLMNHSEGVWDFHYSDDEKFFNPKLARGRLLSTEMESVVNSILDEGICIYPEVVQGNPLNAKNVVRYFLYYDGQITGKKSEYLKSDFILTYSPTYINPYNMELFKPAIDDSMNDHGAPGHSDRTLDLTYFGKGLKHANCFLVKDTIELSREWPKTKEQLATLLKNTRYLYCWDNYSSVVLDALHCGAIPVLMQKEQFIKDTEQKNFPPCAWLEEKDGKAAICIPNDFDEKRSGYLNHISREKSEWFGRVDLFVEEIKIFFP